METGRKIWVTYRSLTNTPDARTQGQSDISGTDIKRHDSQKLYGFMCC